MNFHLVPVVTWSYTDKSFPTCAADGRERVYQVRSVGARPLYSNEVKARRKRRRRKQGAGCTQLGRERASVFEALRGSPGNGEEVPGGERGMEQEELGVDIPLTGPCGVNPPKSCDFFKNA